jgi:hypothetical protein
MMKKWIVIVLIFSALLVVVIVVNQYQRNDGIDGGFCEYETKIYPALLLEILSIDDDSTYFDAAFWVAAYIQDTVYYYQTNNRNITVVDFEENQIIPGQIYQYSVRHILSGSCNPFIPSILFEPYTQPQIEDTQIFQ